MKKIVPYLLAALLMLSAFAHVISPEAYAPLIPPFIPLMPANVLAAIAELAIGVALLLPQYRSIGGLGFFILMLIFLPIHIWDLVREASALGSRTASAIRLVIQFLLIYAGWWIWKKAK